MGFCRETNYESFGMLSAVDCMKSSPLFLVGRCWDCVGKSNSSIALNNANGGPFPSAIPFVYHNNRNKRDASLPEYRRN